MLNDLGECLLKYNKQHPFQLDKDNNKYFEPITADHNLYILHMKGLGRVGIIICADIFNDKLLDLLLKDFQIDLLFVLAYSPGHQRFFDRIALAQGTSCEVVWCNTCAAYEKSHGEQPCVSYWAYGHQDRKNYRELCCGKMLPDVCNGCVYQIEIASDYKKQGKITREVF